MKEERRKKGVRKEGRKEGRTNKEEKKEVRNKDPVNRVSVVRYSF
jgi:hypothetical protein